MRYSGRTGSIHPRRFISFADVGKHHNYDITKDMGNHILLFCGEGRGKSMLYVELYVYDYLKQKKDVTDGSREQIELWGEERRGHFYIFHLRLPENKKAFHRKHMQYLGNFRELVVREGETPELVYAREDRQYREKAGIFVSEDTEDVKNFLICQEKGEKRKTEPEKKEKTKRAAGTGGFLVRLGVYILLLFLFGNMIISLNSCAEMQEVLWVMEELEKSEG